MKKKIHLCYTCVASTPCNVPLASVAMTRVCCVFVTGTHTTPCVTVGYLVGIGKGALCEFQVKYAVIRVAGQNRHQILPLEIGSCVLVLALLSSTSKVLWSSSEELGCFLGD